MTNLQIWLFLVGTPDRAKKLRSRLDYLKPPVLVDVEFGPEPPQCPTTVLFGQRESNRLYSDSVIRPALDAWDQQFITHDDIRRVCLIIEREQYDGPAYTPSIRP